MRIKTASNSAPVAFRTSAICVGVKYPGIATRSSLEQIGIGSLNQPPHHCSKMRVSPVLAGDHQRRERAQVRILRPLLAEFGKFNALFMMRHHMADIPLIAGPIPAEHRQRPTIVCRQGNYA
jgi:hypothetical protein